MKYLHASVSVAMLVIAAGCTTLTAPDEVKALKEATTNFTTAIRAADSARYEAAEAEVRERYRQNAVAGEPIEFTTNCFEPADAANRAFLGQLETLRYSPYDSVAFDTAYRRLRALVPCDVPGATRALPALPAPRPSNADARSVVSVDAANLPTAARNLEAYVAALSDIAGGETSGELDAARANLVESGHGLLGALKIGGPADAILNIVDSAISSIIAARRNAQTREFLNEMDRAMPAMMERMGLAARNATVRGAMDRARAAREIAVDANWALNRRGMTVRQNGRRRGTLERMRLYDETVQRLQVHNSVLVNLRKTDPMTAARAFAAAHRALKDVFNDPRRNRAALAAGLREFRESAVELVEALNED